MTQIYVDMDGVLADFDRHHETVFGMKPSKRTDNVDWLKVALSADFYLGIPPLPDMRELWDFVSARTLPIVLTGVPSSVPEAPANKRGWIAKHLGPDVPVICCLSANKSDYCDPGDVLIDDWEKYRHRWIGRGGRWVTHTSAAASIAELKRLGLG